MTKSRKRFVTKENKKKLLCARGYLLDYESRPN